MGVYNKKALFCHGHSDKNINGVDTHLIKPLVHLLNCKAVNNQPK